MTFADYKAKVSERYHGVTLRDALHNWHSFEENREAFAAWIAHYHRDPMLKVSDGKFGNPRGTLTSMIWIMQSALEPDRSRRFPCLDFEERFQKCFIRRGLIIYLSLMLRELEAATPIDPNQKELTL